MLQRSARVDNSLALRASGSTIIHIPSAARLQTHSSDASVVVLHNDALYHLLLVAVGRLLELGLSVTTGPALAPLLHRGRVCVLEAACNTFPLEDRARGVGHEEDVVIRHGEVEQAKSLVATLILRRLDDAVNGCFVVAAGHEFHGLANVNDLRL